MTRRIDAWTQFAFVRIVCRRAMAKRGILVELDDQLLTKLDALAKRTEVSRSELLRRGALMILQAAEWAQADQRLADAYQKYPPDPRLLKASRRLASETVSDW